MKLLSPLYRRAMVCSRIKRLFMTHPPLAERIAALQNSARRG